VRLQWTTLNSILLTCTCMCCAEIDGDCEVISPYSWCAGGTCQCKSGGVFPDACIKPTQAPPGYLQTRSIKKFQVSSWPADLEVPRDACLTMKISTKFRVYTTIRCLVIALLLLICYVTLWPWALAFVLGQWSYMAEHVVNPSTKFEDPTGYGYRFLSYEFWVRARW